ncbi:7417_t:CDS:2, partial [Funneliformis caledonium]
MPQYCKQLDCRKGASFGPKDSKTPYYCAMHKPVNYVNVKTQCREDGCYKFPHFSFPGSIATSFVTHMKEGMIHLKARTCLEPGCNTHAVFNVVSADKGKYCTKHKQQEMIDIQTKLFYISSMEKIQGQYCVSYKTADMVNVVNRQCEKAGCMTFPSFNLLEEKSARFCEVHRNPEMVNVIGPKCNNISCQKEHYMEYLAIKCHNVTYIKTK